MGSDPGEADDLSLPLSLSLSCFSLLLKLGGAIEKQSHETI